MPCASPPSSLWPAIVQILCAARFRIEIPRWPFDCSGEITIMAFPQAATTPVAPDERLVDPECGQACGGPLHVRFASVRDVQTRAVFSILECAPCGLDNTAPRSKELAKYYRGDHGGRHGMTASYCARRRLRISGKLSGAPLATCWILAAATEHSCWPLVPQAGPARQAGL